MSHFTEISYTFQFLLKSEAKRGILPHNLNVLRASEGYVKQKLFQTKEKMKTKGKALEFYSVCTFTSYQLSDVHGIFNKYFT